MGRSLIRKRLVALATRTPRYGCGGGRACSLISLIIITVACFIIGGEGGGRECPAPKAEGRHPPYVVVRRARTRGKSRRASRTNRNWKKNKKGRARLQARPRHASSRPTSTPEWPIKAELGRRPIYKGANRACIPRPGRKKQALPGTNKEAIKHKQTTTPTKPIHCNLIVGLGWGDLILTRWPTATSISRREGGRGP